jgi:hypothetical protein
MSQQTDQYEKFKIQIEAVLKEESNGLTWSEIRSRLGLPQKVPNNKWVRKLETDISLTRANEKRGTVWKLKQ